VLLFNKVVSIDTLYFIGGYWAHPKIMINHQLSKAISIDQNYFALNTSDKLMSFARK